MPKESAPLVPSPSLQEIVCCMGQPVAGNPMQYVMEKAFAAAGLDLRFLTLEVAPAWLGDAIRGLRAMGFRGAMLDTPHTAAVAKYLDGLSQAAELIGEVTFVQRDEHKLIGDNMIGKGVLHLLRETVEPSGARVVILGAGSAARAITVELALAGAGEIVVVNRTAERGKELVAKVKQDLGVSARFVHWVDEFHVPEETSVLIHATSIGSGNGSPRIPVDLSALRPNGLVIDIRANPPDTKFLRDASALNLVALDGLDVLVSQAVLAFRSWTGIDPDQRVMHEALEEFLMV